MATDASSSAHLVAGVTHTDIMTNVRLMLRTSILPFALTAAIYAFLSARNPIGGIDAEIIRSFEETFSLSPVSFIPAVLMFILPMCKMAVTTSILISAGAAVVIAFFVQNMPVEVIVRSCLFGYESADAGLGAILNGGGMLSMLEVVVILIISCAYSGIFSGTGMLEPVHHLMQKGIARFGRFATCLMLGVGGTILFCNQTITTLLGAEILGEPYEQTGGSMQELAIDMENSNIVAAGFVPWCLGCKVLLTFLDVGPEAVPYAVYIILIPICYLFTKKRWFKDR